VRRRFPKELLCAAAVVSLGPGPARGQSAELPPLLPWSGASETLAAAPEDPWATPAERSGFVTSPDSEQTLAWLQRLAEADRRVRLLRVGASLDGRPIWLAVVSKEGASTPGRLRATGRPTLLVQAGIHAGEIDGKDAGMMLLRDLTVRGERSELLETANLLFVPVLNVDGHARRSPHGRVNQRGPAQTGWRTNGRNLNLNRDYAKLDTPEVRCAVELLRTWPVDLYVDVHVTDGMDYQYDVTYGAAGAQPWSPEIARWFDERARPALDADLERLGHVPGPLLLSVDSDDPGAGILGWTATPRFSNGYGDARHLPTILVENHSLKPFRQRVLGTYVFLESALRLLAEEGDSLREAIRRDRAGRPARVPLAFRVPAGAKPEVSLKGVGWRRELSAISGGHRVVFTGVRSQVRLPVHEMSEPTVVASRPLAYWVPAAWPEVIERLERHGVKLERTSEWRELEVEMYRLEEARLSTSPFEGRMTASARPVAERRVESFPPGSARVPADQELGTLAMLLLEPASPDSFFAWGFFLEALQETEYIEGYVIEPLAERMLEEDAAVALAFEQRLASDPDFARDPAARRRFFYERTPYFDERHRLYPVGRELPE
jgi:murein tripeptide amidase MpaA